MGGNESVSQPGGETRQNPRKDPPAARPRDKRQDGDRKTTKGGGRTIGGIDLADACDFHEAVPKRGRKREELWEKRG